MGIDYSIKRDSKLYELGENNPSQALMDIRTLLIGIESYVEKENSTKKSLQRCLQIALSRKDDRLNLGVLQTNLEELGLNSKGFPMKKERK